MIDLRTAKEGELLPCPFCGTGEARPFHSHDEYGRIGFGVQCIGSTCSIIGPQHETQEEAADAWNRRALPKLPGEGVEPVAWITQAALDNWRKGSDPEKHVLLRTAGDMRVGLYLASTPTNANAEAAREKLREAVDLLDALDTGRSVHNSRFPDKLIEGPLWTKARKIVHAYCTKGHTHG